VLIIQSFHWIFASEKVKKVLKFVWKLLPFSLLIRLFIESNFELAIDSYLQLLCYNNLTSRLDIFSHILGILAGILCFFVPISCGILIYKFHKEGILHKKAILEKYGELYRSQLWNRPELV
jgi:hypothetical protein